MQSYNNNNKYKMKGFIYANPTFTRKNIRKPTVISIKPLVAYDQNRLYFNNLSIKSETNNIVNCTYSELYKALFILTDNYKLYVYNEALELISTLNNWEPKYIVGFQLLENIGVMLLVGTEEIEIMKIKILTNIKKTKFLSSTKFHIKKEAHLQVESEHKLKWNKGYGYIIQEDLLYVWSLQDIHFFSLKHLTLNAKIVNLTKKQLAITTVYYSRQFRYTITGLLNGDIKVWRLPINPLYYHKEILIHNFTYHSKEIDQIIRGADQKTIISYSQDLYICFLSIETFQVLRIFNFSGEYTKIYLFDHHMAYGIKDEYLGQLNYGQNLQFICDLTGDPIYYDSSPHQNVQKEGVYDRLQITLSSNLAIQVNLSDMMSNIEANKIEVINIYPPLKSKNIVQLISCPFYVNVFYILVEDGDVYRAKIEGSSGRIDDHYVIAKIHDTEKHSLNQNASYITFLHIVPPKIDTELIQQVVDNNFNNDYNHKLIQYDSLKLLTIGTSRGSIIFLSVDHMEQIYARLSYHRQKVIKIMEVHNKTNKLDWIVSVCEQRYLKMFNFQNKRGNCIYSIFCGEIYVNMYSFQENLALVMPKGVFQIAKFDNYQSTAVVMLNRQSINHDQEILSINYRSDLKLLITSGKDNKIKIWTIQKILLYEILVNQSLEYCLWASNLNVLVVMHHKMYCLRNLPICYQHNQIQQMREDFYSNLLHEDQISLTQIIQEQFRKLKEKLYKVRTVRKHKSLHESPATNKESKYRQEIKLAMSQKIQVRHDLNKSMVLGFSKKGSPLKKKVQVKTQISYEQSARMQNDLVSIRKHLDQMSGIKKQVQESILPKIKGRNEDIFVQFMRQKLLNKKLLTRRDITLNRIIIKNMIKDHLGNESEVIKSFKLQQ